jgi:hypothetical protein
VSNNLNSLSQPLYPAYIYQRVIRLVYNNLNSLSQLLYPAHIYQRVVCLVLNKLNILSQHLYSGLKHQLIVFMELFKQALFLVTLCLNSQVSLGTATVSKQRPLMSKLKIIQ